MSLEMSDTALKHPNPLLAEDNQLARSLGPVSLIMMGIGAIIGAGIFVMTGRVAAETAGPAVMLSYAVAGLGCALAAFCYAEFAQPIAAGRFCCDNNCMTTRVQQIADQVRALPAAERDELLSWLAAFEFPPKGLAEIGVVCKQVASGNRSSAARAKPNDGLENRRSPVYFPHVAQTAPNRCRRHPATITTPVRCLICRNRNRLW